MFFKETSRFATGSPVGVLTIFCMVFLLFSPLAYADSFSFSAKGLMLMLSVFTVFEISDSLSPINEWETQIQDDSESEELLKKRLAVETDAESFRKFHEHLQEVQQAKREKTKKLSRFKSWFYPAVGVVTTGVILLYTWINGGPA